MTTASPCCWPPIPGIHVCEVMWRADQGMDSAENYPGKNGSFSAGCEPFLRHSMAAGTLGRGRMNRCGEWTGQIHLEAVLVSAGVMCWCGIRAPAPATHHHTCSSLMSITTGGMAGMYCRSPLLVHTSRLPSYYNGDMGNNKVNTQVSL